MVKVVLLLIGLFALLFGMSVVSAHHYSNWDAYNNYMENRVPHNRMYNYFKYGSYWQGDVVIDVSYSYPPSYYPRYVAQPKRRYSYFPAKGFNSYPAVNNIHIYNHNLPEPYGLNTQIVVGCGFVDGYYKKCY